MKDRILLKISGEALSGENCALDFVRNIPELSKKIINLGEFYELVIVMGGGNIFRGINGTEGSNKENNDWLGIKATLVNAEALLNGLELQNAKVMAMSPILSDHRVLPYDRIVALKNIDEGNILILGGGTGKPGCTTDSGAAMRAFELGCKYIVKLSNNIDGVYDKDPNKFDDAKKLDEVTFAKATTDKLGVMDEGAFRMCQENDIPIIVINTNDIANIPDLLANKIKIGTIVKN